MDVNILRPLDFHRLATEVHNIFFLLSVFCSLVCCFNWNILLLSPFSGDTTQFHRWFDAIPLRVLFCITRQHNTIIYSLRQNRSGLSNNPDPERHHSQNIPTEFPIIIYYAFGLFSVFRSFYFCIVLIVHFDTLKKFCSTHFSSSVFFFISFAQHFCFF